MKPVSFLVVFQAHHVDGDELRIIKLYNRNAAAQRDLLNQALVGYDPHHPDAPDTALNRFPVPPKDEWQRFCNVWSNIHFVPVSLFCSV